MFPAPTALLSAGSAGGLTEKAAGGQGGREGGGVGGSPRTRTQSRGQGLPLGAVPHAGSFRAPCKGSGGGGTPIPTEGRRVSTMPGAPNARTRPPRSPLVSDLRPSLRIPAVESLPSPGESVSAPGLQADDKTPVLKISLQGILSQRRPPPQKKVQSGGTSL